MIVAITYLYTTYVQERFDKILHIISHDILYIKETVTNIIYGFARREFLRIR